MPSKILKASEVSLGDLKNGKEYLVVSKLNGSSFRWTWYGPFKHIMYESYRFWEIRIENCEGRQFHFGHDFEKVDFENLKMGHEVHFICGNRFLYGTIVSLNEERGKVSHLDGTRTFVFPGWEFYKERK